MPRWQQWVSSVSHAMQQAVSFNETEFLNTLQFWEEGFVHLQGNPYLQQPTGDSFTLASAIYNLFFA